MGGDDIRRHIVCGMLYRGKRVDVLPHWQHHNAARMLPGTPADAGASRHNAVDLAHPLMPAALFVIVFHVAEGSLVRQRADGARPVRLPAAKNHFRIFMRLTLVLSRKVQVDIRLLVALEAEERLKGNIEPFLVKRRSAHRAVLVRHVAPRAAAVGFHFLGIKIIVMAFRAQIMRA